MATKSQTERNLEKRRQQRENRPTEAERARRRRLRIPIAEDPLP